MYVLKLRGFYILGFWKNIFWEFWILEKYIFENLEKYLQKICIKS